MSLQTELVWVKLKKNLLLGFIKCIVSNRLIKYTKAICFSYSLTHPVSTAESSSLAGSTLHPEHCTVYITHSPCNCKCPWIWTCIYTLYYILNTVHWTPHVYSTFNRFITSHCKHPKFAWVGFKIYMAKCTLI